MDEDHASHDNEEEGAPGEINMEESFEGDEKIVKDTAIKVVMRSDIVAPQAAKKSKD